MNHKLNIKTESRSSRLKIVFVAEYYPFYAAKLVHETAKRLVRKGCEVTVFTSNFHVGKKAKIPTEEEIIEGVHVTRFDVYPLSAFSTSRLVPNPLGLPRIQKEIIRAIMYSDILHLETGHGPLNLLVASLANMYKRSRKCKMVYTSHGIPGGYDSPILNFGSIIAKKVIKHLIIKNCSLVTTVGIRDLDYWVRSGIPPEKIYYVPNGVDTKGFVQSAVLRQEFRRQLGFHNKDFVVLFLAQFRRAKGLTTLLTVIPKAISSIPNIKFLIVGSGPMVREADFSIRKLGLEDNVRLLSYYVPDKDLPGLYNACDVYVLPSFIEGMPLSLMEAMACGRPVIATNVGDVPLLVEDGVNGFLVPSGSPKALFQKILCLYNQPKRMNAMQSNNVKKMSKYDWQKTSERYLQLYLKLENNGGN